MQRTAQAAGTKAEDDKAQKGRKKRVGRTLLSDAFDFALSLTLQNFLMQRRLQLKFQRGWLLPSRSEDSTFVRHLAHHTELQNRARGNRVRTPEKKKNASSAFLSVVPLSSETKRSCIP
jgi:hypothetical protein